MNRRPRYFTPRPLIPRLIRWCYAAMFAAILLLGAYYLLVYVPRVHDSGSTAPTTTQFVPKQDQGETVYITEQQQARLNFYGATFAVGLLSWLMLGLLLETRLKIRIFRGVPAPLPREPKHSPPTSFSSN